MIRILSIAIPARILTLVLTETAILFGCYFFAVWIDPDIPEIASFVQFDAGLQRIALLIATTLLGFYFRNLYSQVRVPDRLTLAQELITVLGAALVLQGLIYYVARDYTVPRKLILIGSPVAFGAIFLWRLFFDAAARDARVAEKILFLGISNEAREITAYLQTRTELGISPVGYLSEHPHDADLDTPDLRRLGSFRDLDRVFDRFAPSALVIAQRSELRPASSEDFLELEFGGVRIEEVHTLYERIFGRVPVSYATLQRAAVSDALSPDPITSRIQSIYAPAIALLLLIATSPLFLILAAWIKLTSRGALFHVESRTGLDGQPFRMWSFRVERGLIRRLGLHTLPRLWNVVNGTMSLVGPEARPIEADQQLAATLPLYRQRSVVKPGLTGWEQVHRHLVAADDPKASLEYDLYYIKHIAPSLDSAVLMLALKAKFL